MGCGPSTDEDFANQEIDKKNKKEQNLDNNVRKLLLLGTGGSGKSTIFRNLKRIHGELIRDKRTINETANTVRTNVTQGMYTLLARSTKLYNMDPEYNKDCYLDLEKDESLEDYIELIVKYGNDSLDPMSMDNEILSLLSTAISKLWNLPQIQATFKKRGGNFSFPDNLDYFYNKVKEVMSAKYEPTEEDIIKARVRTTGVVGYEYQHRDLIFSITDVGGQRNERKKWIHQFEHVSAVIYVAALNHYNSVLFEDEKVNAMHESLKVFKAHINLEYFLSSEVILFLNKDDLFRKELKSGVPLSVCFNEDNGWTHEQWNGPNYKPKEDPDEDENYFDECYKKAVQFIEICFTNRNKQKGRVIYAHVTKATDTTSVDQVFLDVQHVVIRSNLKQGGLIS